MTAASKGAGALALQGISVVTRSMLLCPVDRMNRRASENPHGITRENIEQQRRLLNRGRVRSYARLFTLTGGCDGYRCGVRGALIHKGELRGIRQTCQGGKARVGSPADWPVPGLLAHIAGQGKNGFRVVDVWESQEAFRRFGEMLVPILRSLGIEGEPEVYEAHTFVSA